PGGAPGALFAITTAIAPAACAAAALITKLQVPRSIRAILPAIGLVIGVHASLVGGAVSTTSASWPETVPALTVGPNAAVPNGRSPSGGVVTRTISRAPSVDGAAANTSGPSHTRWLPLIVLARRCASESDVQRW